eukprot:gnl/TRDRNA2_/TRDRNA2_157286_c0_seq1.p1 gnl/TRDRNA2_/TRDRNA2_157286_c0~~gnl/TRDRNA2_/TRDRNA2_157286_c0_seq1.p1  ORF type:complete len:364 (-),score=102.46 gnl/TRDRNA2_/TRDRNA2_157286_c0_seq1:48-1094(-)
MAQVAAAKAKAPKLEKEQQALVEKEKSLELVISQKNEAAAKAKESEESAKKLAATSKIAAALTVAAAAALAAIDARIIDVLPAPAFGQPAALDKNLVYAAEALAGAVALGAVSVEASIGKATKDIEDAMKSIADTKAEKDKVAAEAAKVAEEAREAAAAAAAGVVKGSDGSSSDPSAGAEDARRWIQAWREKTQKGVAAPENVAAPDWFQSATEVLKGGEAGADASAEARSAKKWIQDWRETRQKAAVPAAPSASKIFKSVFTQHLSDASVLYNFAGDEQPVHSPSLEAEEQALPAQRQGDLVQEAARSLSIFAALLIGAFAGSGAALAVLRFFFAWTKGREPALLGM